MPDESTASQHIEQTTCTHTEDVGAVGGGVEVRGRGNQGGDPFGLGGGAQGSGNNNNQGNGDTTTSKIDEKENAVADFASTNKAGFLSVVSVITIAVAF